MSRNRNVLNHCATAHLLLAMLGRGFGFIQALQASVHPLVESPVSIDGDPMSVERVLDVEQRLDGSLQHRRVCHVKPKQ